MKRVHVVRRVRFSAGHNYQNLPEGHPARSRSRYGHGHNYVVDATVAGELSQDTGMVVNISDIDRVLKQIVGPLDQTHLELDHPEVADGLTSTESLARWIWQQAEGQIEGGDLTSVVVRESEFLRSEFRGEAVVYVTRSYDFAAAHRLHSSCLTDDENVSTFGKCNNPNGHGHNYAVEVTVKGEIDSRTGMACDIDAVDEAVNQLVLGRLDHKHLNLDVPEFAGINPTSENVAVVIWSLLEPALGGSLHRVRVGETERNYFEYYGNT